MTRCGCDICLVDPNSFMNCKEKIHYKHRYSLARLDSARTYPTPSDANYDKRKTRKSDPGEKLNKKQAKILMLNNEKDDKIEI